MEGTRQKSSVSDTTISSSTGTWLFVFGFLTGIFATFTITILVGWLIDVATPHSSWLNKVFYGYVLGNVQTN